MKTLAFIFATLLIPSPAFAQTRAAADDRLATPTGNEVHGSIGGYKYVEPGDLNISIHGPKFGGGYTGTFGIDRRQHLFGQADVRASFGNTKYDGWCMPFLIVPNSSSPNGYELDLGDASPCSETGDRDWYIEGRGLVGKDFIGRTWAWSPHSGLGVRHLSNGVTGVNGYRSENYLYLPIGLTARTAMSSHKTLSVDFEYDQLLRGWQTTRDSALGGGDIPATPTAPAFTIQGFTDISFTQHSGWAVRASAKYQLTSHWSVEPLYIHWKVNSSPVEAETITFTVNQKTAQEQFGAYEPLNSTNEFLVKLAFRR